MDKSISLNFLNIVNIAKEAGEKILEIYKNDEIWVKYKTDKSPITIADQISNKIIKNGLKSFSDFNIISEEESAVAFEERKKWEYFWLVDPLDGTKEFLSKNDQFTVNISLVHFNRPILGVVYAPALNMMYFGGEGIGAFKEERGEITKLTPIHKKAKKGDNIKVVVSKSHLDEKTESFLHFLSKSFTIEKISIGSSLKLCLVAEGKADIYPRLSPTMEWDTAAADAILSAVGGSVLKFEDIGSLYDIKNLSKLEYNKLSMKNPPFVAISSNDIFE